MKILRNMKIFIKISQNLGYLFWLTSKLAKINIKN